MQMHIARSVRFPVQKGKVDEFKKVFTNEILPVLKTQDGFKNELLLVNDEHVVGVSLWRGPDALKKYETSTYPKVAQKLAGLMNGQPQIERFELSAINPLPA
jgi:heme-degrading monooxygenase HmoA